MSQLQLPIFPAGLTPITNDLAFQKEDGLVVYFSGHLPVFHHDEKDLKSFRMRNARQRVHQSVDCQRDGEAARYRASVRRAMPTYWKICLLVAVLFCRPTLAGQITMKNGDRLTGAIVKFDGKNLMMKSEFAGSVTIPWEAVESISSSTPLHVTVKGGQILAGTVTTAGGSVEIQTE